MLFLAYADADQALYEELASHLAYLQSQGELDVCSHRSVAAGEDPSASIDRMLERATVVLLLVSADFLASAFCTDGALDRTIARHARGETHVIPVILRPCLWQTAPFAKLRALPDGGTPVTTWKRRDDAWLEVVRHLVDRVDARQVPDTEASPGQDSRSGFRWSFLLGATLAKLSWFHGERSRRVMLDMQFRMFADKLGIPAAQVTVLLESIDVGKNAASVMANAKDGIERRNLFRGMLQVGRGDRSAAGFSLGYDLVNVLPQLEFLELGQEASMPPEQVDELRSTVDVQLANLVRYAQEADLARRHIATLAEARDALVRDGPRSVRDRLTELGGKLGG